MAMSSQLPDPPQATARGDANERLDRVVRTLVGDDGQATSTLPTPRVILPDEEQLAVPLVPLVLVEQLDALHRERLVAEAFAFFLATVPTAMVVNVLTSNAPLTAVSTVAWIVFAVTVTLTCCAAGVAVRSAVRAGRVRRELLGRGNARR